MNKIQIRCNTWDNHWCIFCCVYKNRIYESSKQYKYPASEEDIQEALEEIVRMTRLVNPEVQLIEMKPLDFSQLKKFGDTIVKMLGL